MAAAAARGTKAEQQEMAGCVEMRWGVLRCGWGELFMKYWCRNHNRSSAALALLMVAAHVVMWVQGESGRWRWVREDTDPPPNLSTHHTLTLTLQGPPTPTLTLTLAHSRLTADRHRGMGEGRLQSNVELNCGGCRYCWWCMGQWASSGDNCHTAEDSPPRCCCCCLTAVGVVGVVAVTALVLSCRQLPDEWWWWRWWLTHSHSHHCFHPPGPPEQPSTATNPRIV